MMNGQNNYSNNNNPQAAAGGRTTVALCASCDRCRTRKTKCDGNRPCLNCATRYKKVMKVDSIEGVDLAEFDCVYSPAKRRGPVPGRGGGGMKNVSRTTVPGVNYNQQQPYPQQAMQQHNNLNGGMLGMGLNGMGGQQQQQVGQHQTLSTDQLTQMLQLQQNLLVQQQQMQQQQGLNLQPQQQQQQGLMQQVTGVMQGQGTAGGNANFSAAGGGMVTASGVGMANLNTSNLGNTYTGIDTNLIQNLQVQQQQIPYHQAAQLLNNQVNNMNQQTVNDQVNQLNQQMLVNNLSMNQPIPNGQNQMNHQMPPNNIQIPNGQNQMNHQMPPNNIQIPNGQNQINQHMPPNNIQIQMIPSNDQNQVNQSNGYNIDDNRSAKRIHTVKPVSNPSQQTSMGMNLPDSIANFLPLLQLNNPEGTVLRSYYELSTNDVLGLPPIPTDDGYCALLAAKPNSKYDLSQPIPTYDQSALNAARFSELSLGALANNQISLALELSNACVMCLRNCVEKPSDTSCMYDVARAYLLHGIFRSKRGDMVRYFKYRRVCMAHISAMKGEPHVDALLAAISFHDAWAYMMHNASEEALPDISESLPQCLMQGLSKQAAVAPVATTANETKYGCSTNPAAVASNPQNEMWIQGPPPVFLNNEADLVSRSLDAFAFACRSCCDQANSSFEEMARAAGLELPGSSHGGSSPTPTTMAVMAHENELCSRNIVLSAKTLLESATSGGKPKKHGLTMVAHAMSAFLENKQSGKANLPEDASSCTSNDCHANNEDGSDGSSVGSGGGFSENQIKNLLVACNIIIQNPLLLHAPGNIYHMASNAAILLCHLLNGIYSCCNAAAKQTNGNGASSPTNEAETALFDEALDVFMSMRKLLDMHRSALPVKLRCHGIPRPSGLGPWKKAENADGTQRPFIEMGDTLMCLGRGCQAFVLMGCSPCVAAERAMKAAQDCALNEGGELTDPLDNDLFNELDGFHLEDDQLLGVLERIVEN